MSLERERERLLELAWKTENEVNGSVLCRDSLIIESVLRTGSVDIPEDAVFTGRFSHLNVMKEIIAARVAREESFLRAKEDMKSHFEAQDSRVYTGLYDFGHTAPDWENIYRLGFSGLLQRLKDAAKEAASAEEREYCAAGIRVWNAAIEYVTRMSERAMEMGKREMADGLLSLTRNPPQSLYEAMQLSFLYYDLQQHVEQTLVRTLGRLDRFLLPFFERDLATGFLTEKQAEQLIDSFLLAWDAREITANAPFSVGGTDPEGGDTVNSLSYLLLRRHTALKLPNVKIHILYTPSMPKDFLRIALDGIRNGGNSIVFLNDGRVTESLTGLGIDRSDAQRYEVVGCYEPSAKGEVPCSCNGRVNLARAVESALEKADDSFSYEDLLNAFYQEVEAFCKGSMLLVNAWESRNHLLHSAPFFSATMDACVEKKTDVYCQNGAKYNNSSVNLVGLATAVDGLLAIRKAVFEDRLLLLSEFKAILKSDWENAEILRMRILKRYPKYGNGDSDADSLAREIFFRASACVNRRPNQKNGVYRLGGFSIDWRMGFGRRMGATADGRRAGEPLSKNLSASVGADREGVTAQILSAASLDGNLMPNGSVLDLVLHASSVAGETGLEALATTLHTYMRLGGMAIQYSVLDASILRAARKDPEAYPNLQVRLCGWNALFASLSPKEQEEFILSAENR